MQQLSIKRMIHSRVVRWALYTGLFFTVLMTVLRLVFFLFFRHLHLTWGESVPSFILGLRYDLRVAAIIMLMMLIFGSIRPFNPYGSSRARKIWFWVLGIITTLFCFFYALDFGHYAYLSQRLNASVMNYMEDAGISLSMVWQSYPVIKIILGLSLSIFLMMWVIKRLYRKAAITPVLVSRKNSIIVFIIAFLVFGIGIFGRIGQYPLRWSFAFSFGNDNKANLALNPVQSFFSTLKFRNSTFDIAKTRSHYKLMAAQLNLTNPDSVALNYVRTYPAFDSLSGKKPNVVLVLCESFTAYKSSMYGNPLNTTPYFKSLCDSGIFFNRCFTPMIGTARGIWALLTGIPDVEAPKTASRNMAMVSQRLTLNDFIDYEKYYMLGGSASWANIRGLLKNNVKGLHLYEGDDYKSPKINVWGVSDKNLFLESNQYLSKQGKKPFFAIIQSAGNHRPYTVPSEDKNDFKELSFPQDTLAKYGFFSNEEMNSFRYTDFCFKALIEDAKKQTWFNNTIFIFIGDHGIKGNAADMFPKAAWTDHDLGSHHVPLLFYAPALLKPELRKDICSQIDIMPSIASLAGIPYHNYTLGRNLFDKKVFADTLQNRQVAFIGETDAQLFGMIDSNYFYFYRLPSRKGDMVSVKNNLLIGNSQAEEKARKKLKEMTDAYYETSRYMLFNNKHEQQ
jgi:phosphoglycerol transferase MdoB-like AlkP superfamily enzyme